MARQFSWRTLLPWLAAFAVLLAAWLLPLPDLALSEDQFASENTPQIRAETEAAGDAFLKAQQRYNAYIKSHDVGAARSNAEQAARDAKTQGNPETLITLRDNLMPVREYAGELHLYAEAGQAYFDALRKYDDNLMSVTRSLGAALERLRNETWPFVEYLKKYPPPIGEVPDPPMVTASEVLSQTTLLDQHIAALNPNPNPHAGELSRGQVIDAINADIQAIWASGRSVESLGSLHAEYHALLQTYDGKVQAAATGGNGQSAGRATLATVLNLGIALLVVAGVAGLLMPPLRKLVGRAAGP